MNSERIYMEEISSNLSCYGPILYSWDKHLLNAS